MCHANQLDNAPSEAQRVGHEGHFVTTCGIWGQNICTPMNSRSIVRNSTHKPELRSISQVLSRFPQKLHQNQKRFQIIPDAALEGLIHDICINKPQLRVPEGLRDCSHFGKAQFFP